jgi:hypothetical protein
LADLPTWNQILGHAQKELDRSRDGLSEAAAWLRSDWAPGSPLPDEPGTAQSEARVRIGEAKALIDQVKRLLHEARAKETCS